MGAQQHLWVPNNTHTHLKAPQLPSSTHGCPVAPTHIQRSPTYSIAPMGAQQHPWVPIPNPTTGQQAHPWVSGATPGRRGAPTGVGGVRVLGAARATRAALDEVTARHQELLRLERGLRELGELFVLLGTTVEGQGEVIDRIEKNILESGTCVRKGHQHLGTAREHQRGARRKKLLVAACVLVTVLIVAAIIAATAATG
ncbi:Syntaxin 4 [Aix galericulata]|nr:Syntaxin 4 [Aix galericulata]